MELASFFPHSRSSCLQAKSLVTCNLARKQRQSLLDKLERNKRGRDNGAQFQIDSKTESSNDARVFNDDVLRLNAFGT